jgi:hypothetical protein
LDASLEALRLTRFEPIGSGSVQRHISEREDGISSATQGKGKKTETGLKIIQIDQDLRSDVAKSSAIFRAKQQSRLSERLRPKTS